MIETWTVHLAEFHFLRPWWFLLLLPLLLISWIHRRQQAASLRWRHYIAPHLLEHLVIDAAASKGFTPQLAAMCMMTVFIIALAGPSWEKEPSPFAEDNTAMVIALNLSSSMLSSDVQPSRLALAKLKISELLALRKGAPTALLVYAGSAHTVLPLTEDTAVLNFYVQDLQPDVLPDLSSPQQIDTLAAVTSALQLLASSAAVGTILLVTDGTDPGQKADLIRLAEATSQQISWLVIGTGQGVSSGQKNVKTGQQVRAAGVDIAALKNLAADMGAGFQLFTADNADIDAIQYQAQQFLAARNAINDSQQWRDFGYYLLWPGGLLALLWFRRGMVVQWD